MGFFDKPEVDVTRGVTKAVVTFGAVGYGDPDTVREKGLTGAERIKSLTENFVGIALAYGMREENIDTSVEGEVTLNHPNKDALAAAKYLSYTKLSPSIPAL